MDNRLVNINGLAAALKIPRSWLEREVKANRLPCLRIGVHRRFNVDAVIAELARRAAQMPEDVLDEK